MRYLILLILLAFCVLQCANPIAPTGGPKDEQAPQIDSTKSTPNLQTNFRPKTIELTFDEWVKLEQANQRVVISPPLQGYTIRLKGKTVIVDLGDQDTLRNNVTYVIQFGEAVKDLTEGNAAADLRFVFSTGPYIDSLELQGQVVDAYTAEPVKDALVMLYDNLADSVFRTERPFYFGRTNEEGLFLISNIRAGTFKLAALVDADANYRFNQVAEQIAFSTDSIQISADSVPPISLRMFREQVPLQIAETDSSQWGRLKLSFNRPPKKDLILDGTATFLQSTNRDSIFIWHKADARWKLYAQSDTTLNDTISIASAAVESAAQQLPPLDWVSVPGASATKPPVKPVVVDFNRPIAGVDTSLFLLQQDTLEENLPISWEIDSTDRSRLLISRSWKEGASYSLNLLPGAITDYWGQSHTDTLESDWNISDRKRFGNLKIIFSGTDTIGSYHFRLLIKGKEPIAVFDKQGDLNFTKQFTLLPPGDYQLEVIEDRNGNGQWDPGHYDSKRQPERVVTRTFDSLRANWDLEITLDITDLFRD